MNAFITSLDFLTVAGFNLVGAWLENVGKTEDLFDRLFTEKGMTVIGCIYVIARHLS